MNKIEIDVLSRSGGSHNHKLTAVMANYRTIQTKHMQRILELEQ